MTESIHDSTRNTTITVPVLARVEGEGALTFRVSGGAIHDLQLKIFEPPRLFEKFLEGRSHQQVIDSVARICGICPVAYQMSAVHALEGIFGVTPSATVRDLRRVMYCGEWLESHALHIHLLAAPDFLGYANAVAMAKDHPEEVRRGLRLQALGNKLIKLLGGRSVHPVGVRVGGFFAMPGIAEVKVLLQELADATDDARSLLQWLAQLRLPNDEQDFVSVSLQHPHEYPMNEGRIVGSDGLDIDIADYQAHFTERHVSHSTALHSLYQGQPYLVGPLARVNNNWQQLHAPVLELMNSLDISFPSRNMFHSVLARALEIYYAILEAQTLLQYYLLTETTPQQSLDPITAKAGIGFGCTEAPRGILWHRYELDEGGHVQQATIVPPTSQNQARMEQDLQRSLTSFGLQQADDVLRQHAETVIRNYDPCISCSTHFLKLKVNRD